MKTDTQIQQDVMAELSWEPSVNAAQIGVEVSEPAASASVVKADIEAALKRRAQRHSEAIRVEVEGSNVTLTGIVNSWAERDLARNSAWGAPGVRNVNDNMTVTF